jgi:hypothetical protein
MSLTKAEQTIQHAAWKQFPAQELWIKDDKYFWSYEKRDGGVSITEGVYKDGDIDNRTLLYKTDNVDTFVHNQIIEKISDGWKCFASQLFE